MNSQNSAGSRPFVFVFVVLLLGLAIVFFGNAYKPCIAEGISMEPTLYPGQIFLLDKIAYQAGHLPQRGDLIVFNDRTNGAVVLKRVLGLPGDKIQLNGRDIIINNVPIQRQALKSRDETHLEFIETLPDGAAFHTFENKDVSATTISNPENASFDVPTGRYFVVGDNRDSAHDSRNGRGYVPVEDIVGKAVLVFSNGGH